MPCDHARTLLGAYVDGELTGAARQAAADQVRSCPACADAADDIRRIGRQLNATGREIAPPQLAQRIRDELAKEMASDRPVPSRLATTWRAPAARFVGAMVAASVVSSLITWSVATWPRGEVRLENDVVSAHIRSLLQDSPIQVASSDNHTVKPWFNGRIDFAPEVKDFTSEGFPLLGGRIDYIGGRRVGAIVYKRHLHVINVFMWPAAAPEPADALADVAKGYNVLHWSKAGVTYWAISDLNADEMRQLHGLL